ncbi:ATP:guanido phosphotransferase [Desulfofarcimen acetoxidans DSM 771]|jgi:protein arginine kinase|uniref:Protein-arginine kinase n=1 Tax=Desulfofarcimen acetoxidans (strain ATCC 49208 / DSM 771 / KCTC 5769 / VKM B-1644 / 5575) TaxID=485916 RepID=C8W3V3_DESAS|nr:protein arginine kinase [Desulfofarcimen acetoxidans]ACV61207.1 ATP:guanido phosphotransferase [Desulfofarcimen acetoxidans DSM 771]
MSLRDIINNTFSNWMDSTAPEADIVISSRIRIARNLKQWPFPHMLPVENAEQVIHAVKAAVSNENFINSFGSLELVWMSELTPVERRILVEKHLISPDLLDNYNKKAVILRSDEAVSIMINEEDHLRLQCVLPGLQLKDAWSLMNKLDDGLEFTLDYSYSDRLGYLTACPTNVGTGLRASVMIHLPGLVLANQIGGVLSAIAKLGITVRGMYGEGTQALGNIFQISNQITLGQAEEEIINNIISITRQLLAQERAARQALLKERNEFLADRVCRSLGILKHARMINAEETMRMFSDVRLGVDLNIIEGIDTGLLSELMVLSRPAYLIKKAGKEITTVDQDILRAELIRERLNG